MTAIGLSRLCAGRVHYAWIVLAVMFSATLAGVGVRAAPGVLILPLQRAFGWDVSTISGAVSVNIILLGVTAPFLTGLIEVIVLANNAIPAEAALAALLDNIVEPSGLGTSPWRIVERLSRCGNAVSAVLPPEYNAVVSGVVLARHRERHRLSLSGEDMVRRVDQLDQHFGFAKRSEHLAVQHGCNCLALHGPVSHRRGSSKGRR